MKIEAVFSKIIFWLKTSEMFAQPSKQIFGRWELYEYYTEPAGELLNVKEEQLKKKGHFLQIEFLQNGEFNYNTNIPLAFFSEKVSYNWRSSKNFITLIPDAYFGENLDFQFAIEKQTIKLLKKDAEGRIQLFAFLRKKDEPTKF